MVLTLALQKKKKKKVSCQSRVENDHCLFLKKVFLPTVEESSCVVIAYWWWDTEDSASNFVSASVF